MIQRSRGITLGPETKVTFAFLGLILGGVFVTVWRGAVWTTGVDAHFVDQDKHFDVVDEHFQTMEDIIKASDRWRGMDMRRWAEQLKELNPELKIPNVVTESEK